MSEHSHIAGLLREAREKRGLSLEAAASESGIPLRYVQLLEGENPSIGIPDEFYLIPFFRKYGSFVGVDVERLLPEFLGQVQHVPAEAPLPATPGLGRPFALSLDNLWKPAAVFGAVALASFLMLRNSPEPIAIAAAPGSVGEVPVREAPPAPAPVVEAEAAPMRVAVAAPAELPEPAPAVDAGRVTPAESAAPSEPLAADAADGRELHILATETVWLEIARDEGDPEEFWLEPGDTHTWTAADSFTLKVGNAGGVTLAFDGRKLPPLGDSGQVVRLRLPKPAEHARAR